MDPSANVVALPAAPLHAALPLVPRPRSVVLCSGGLAIGDVNGIVVDDDPNALALGQRLASWLGLGESLVRAIPAGAPGPSRPIVLRLDAAAGAAQRVAAVDPPSDLEDESYSIDVSSERAVVRAHHPAGLFYAMQTVAQLAGARPVLGVTGVRRGAHDLPCVHIEDAPAHRVRAMHLDVARHYFDVATIERYVDLLSFYRFNVFHWHLTDDQGFRFTVRSHPELTLASAYTQDEMRAVVSFAKARFVTVLPEIEMPGHARAILASHPELSCTGKKQPIPSTWGVFDDVLCAGNEATYTLLDDILRETTEVFPSRLVHLGGDEVPKARWNACPKCRARMARDKLSAEQLQGAFLKRAGAMLATHGRRMVAWDDALDGGLTSDGVVTAWQGADRGRAAAVAGHDVVMVPADTTYFNFWQSRATPQPGHEGLIPWTRVLAFDPVPPGLDASQAAHVLGGGGALWTEYVKTDAELETLLMPRLAALSEALWSASSDAAGFPARFTAQRPMLDASNVHYFVEPPAGLRPKSVFLDTATLDLVTPSIHPDGVVHFTLDGTDPTDDSPVFTAPIVLRATTAAAARLFLPGGPASAVVRGTFEHASLRPAVVPPADPAAFHDGVLYKYFEGDFHAVPDFGALVPRRSGRLERLSFDPAFRAQQFAVVYDAWFRAAGDGVYRFVTHADDGVVATVDGAAVVNDDGEHAARDSDGEIALARGLHRIRLGYFQGTGGKELTLACEGPGTALGPCALMSP